MSGNRLAALVVGAMLAAFASACNETANTSNVNGNTVASNASMTSNASNANTMNIAPANNAPAMNTNGYATPKAPNNVPTARATKAPEPKLGSGGNDFYLFTKARGALNADDELKNSNVIINISEGVLTLTGTIANPSQKTRAEQLMRSVEGVKGVKNQLRISAGGTNPGPQGAKNP